MNKLEVTIYKADELILAMTRLTEALENKLNTAESFEKEKTPIVREQLEAIELPANDELPVTLEQIRAVLTAKSQAGKKAAIQGLFKKYEADKLTAVDPARYADLLKEAEEL